MPERITFWNAGVGIRWMSFLWRPVLKLDPRMCQKLAAPASGRINALVSPKIWFTPNNLINLSAQSSRILALSLSQSQNIFALRWPQFTSQFCKRHPERKNYLFCQTNLHRRKIQWKQIGQLASRAISLAFSQSWERSADWVAAPE